MPQTVLKPNKKRLSPALIILVGLALGYVAYRSDLSVSLSNILQRIEPGTYAVTYVDDGDTIRVKDSLGQQDTVRLIGIDTPEVKDPRKPVQCFGEAASNFTKHALRGAHIKLVSDPLSADRDKYNRLLRYVYLSDGTFFNAKLVSEGYAFAYVVFLNSHQDEFVALERQARQQNKGLWAGCSVDDTSKIKQTVVN